MALHRVESHKFISKEFDQSLKRSLQSLKLAPKVINKLFELYLSGDFPKELLIKHKTRLETMLANLHKKQHDLARHIRKVDQLATIEAFCAKIRHGLDQAEFNTRKQIIELLDVRAKSPSKMARK